MTVCDFIWKSETLSNIDKEKHMEIDGVKSIYSGKFISTRNYDLGIKFVQQEYTEDNQFTSEAVISEDNVVLTWGKWPKNCENGRISFDSGKKFFYIVSRESDKKLILNGFPQSGTFKYVIRLSEFDLGEVKLSANRSSNFKLEEWSAILEENSKNVMNEYVSVIDIETISTAICPNIISASVVETKRAQNIYYWLVFYPNSETNERAEVKIFNRDKNLWRIIARNRAGFWEYNNSGDTTSETWVLASINDLLHAVSEAVSSKKVNRMTGEDLTAITKMEWGLLDCGREKTEYIARGLTLNSTDSKNNPAVSQFCLNYEK